MIFFFEQRGRYMRCELMPLGDGSAELIVVDPDGAQTREFLPSSSDIPRRVAELSETLHNAGWWGPVGRDI
jgi:hypothetical protein